MVVKIGLRCNFFRIGAVLLKKIAEFGITIPYIHSSNTAGIIRFDNCHFNFARTGGGTYGLYKSAAIDELGQKKYKLNLQLAICWKSKIMLKIMQNYANYCEYKRFIQHKFRFGQSMIVL